MIDASRGLDRRGFIQLATAGAELAGGLAAAVAQPSQTMSDITRQPRPSFATDPNTADILVDMLGAL